MSDTKENLDWRLNAQKALLLIIDVQEKLTPVIANRQEVVKNSSILCAAARLLNIPVVVSEQYPQGLGATIPELKAEAEAAAAQFFSKTRFTAATADILQAIEESGASQLILCGMETHICVWQTALDLLGQGYEVYLATDAVGSRKEAHRQWAISALELEEVRTAPVETLIYEMLADSRHPQFKAVSALIK